MAVTASERLDARANVRDPSRDSRRKDPEEDVTKLEFYFDYLSPYSYLAWTRIDDVCERHGLELEPKPVLLAGLLDESGQLGPAEIPAKRRWMGKDVLRYAAEYDLEVTFPNPHPFNPLAPLRVSVPEACGEERQVEVIDAIFRAAWRDGRVVSEPGELAQAIDGVVDEPRALLEKTQESEVKDALREATEAAAARDVFGVPTMRVGGEAFWGNDRFAMLERYLEGEDEYDREAYEALLEGRMVER